MIGMIVFVLLVSAKIQTAYAAPDTLKVETAQSDDAAADKSKRTKASLPHRSGDGLLYGTIHQQDARVPAGPQPLSKYGIELGGVEKHGRLVCRVKAGSIAEKRGIRVGDIVLSAQTPKVAALKIQRRGKVYMANLTINKDSYNIMAHMAGRYSGPVSWPTVVVGGGISYTRPEMITEFNVNANGVMTGAYSEATGCNGYLDNGRLISEHEASFTWHDSFGTGLLTVEFSPDYNSFNGIWNFQQCASDPYLLTVFGPTTQVLKWQGQRR